MNFLQRFDPETLKKSRAYRVFNKGTYWFNRFGALNLVFLGVVGIHVYEQ
jgi:hypothetical protein